MGSWAIGGSSGGSTGSGGGFSLNTGAGGGSTGGSWGFAPAGSTGGGSTGSTGAIGSGLSSSSFLFEGSDPFGINPSVAIAERDLQTIHYLGDDPIAQMLEPKQIDGYSLRNVLIFFGLLVVARRL